MSAPREFVVQLRDALAIVVSLREALEYGDREYAVDLAAGLEADLLAIVERAEADGQ